MKFHYIGSVFSDPCPGLAQSWEVYVGRDKHGQFHISLDGENSVDDEEASFEIGSAKEAAEWIIDDSSLDETTEVVEYLQGKWGFSKLIKELESE